MHPLGVGGGMAPGRDSGLWLSDLKAVTINNRTWGARQVTSRA